MDEDVLLASLARTCGACPAQWEGVATDGRIVYVRFRYGSLQVGIGDSLDEAVYNRDQVWTSSDELDGSMDTSEMLMLTDMSLEASR